jgi:hypothetical protein
MEGAYSMYGGEGRCVQVLVEKLEGNSHFKNLDIDGRIIVLLIFKELNLQEVEWKVIDWIELTLDGDRWGGSCECGNKLLGISLLAEDLPASQEGIRSLELVSQLVR